MPTTTQVIYHGNCQDGMTAAWAAWKRFGDSAEYRAANYGDPLPMIDDGTPVFVLDFSYPRATLVGLERRCPVTVLDHHKTAQADLDGLSFAIFDAEMSGASLAWWYFHDSGRTQAWPRIVQYVEDRDLWRFALPESREISQWLRCFPYTLDAWDAAAQQLEARWDLCARDGRAMLRFQDQAVSVMADRAVWRDIGGYRVPVVNATVFFSEVGERLCSLHPEAPFAAYYFDRQDGKRQWGMRSRGDFDCSAVAKKLGGGGHPGAAGFTEEIPA